MWDKGKICKRARIDSDFGENEVYCIFLGDEIGDDDVVVSSRTVGRREALRPGSLCWGFETYRINFSRLRRCDKRDAYRLVVMTNSVKNDYLMI